MLFRSTASIDNGELVIALDGDVNNAQCNIYFENGVLFRQIDLTQQITTINVSDDSKKTILVRVNAVEYK